MHPQIISPVELTDRCIKAMQVFGVDCPGFNLIKEVDGRGIFITSVRHVGASPKNVRWLFYFTLSDGRELRFKCPVTDPVKLYVVKRFNRFIHRGE